MPKKCNHTVLCKGVTVIIIIIIHFIKLHHDVLWTYESKDGLGLLNAILVILLVHLVCNEMLSVEGGQSLSIYF